MKPSRVRPVKKHVILFLAANPQDTGRLALDDEAHAIHLELKRSGYRDRFDFVTRWAVKPLDLLRELRELKPTVVHFSGHGSESLAAAPDAAQGHDVGAPAAYGEAPSGLYFQGAAGGAQVVLAEAIAQAFGSVAPGVRLVVLSACFTARVAEALLAHVDCVVGMSGAIHDAAARIFASGFYGGLGEHESIAAAFEQGKAAIHLDGLSQAERPQLKVRDGFDAAQLILAKVAPSVLAKVPCPYPGMRPYTADDAGCFHGRDTEITELIGRLRAGEREIFVIGPSGSGKSSLVTAGVLPQLARGVTGLGPFVVRELRPGEQPASRLGQALEATAGKPLVVADCVAGLLAYRGLGASLLLVVDQLEELFTLASGDERAQFLDALRALRAEPRCAVVLTLRADFFGVLMESPLWAKRRGQLSRVEVGPLRDEALREAIAAPARAVDVTIEPDLIERLVGDAAYEPGILPLLQETLVQLWDARVDQTLTLADYEALGDGERSGLAVALARRADATLHQLTVQEAIARRILLRLISFGEGRSDTRRQQPRSKLCASAEETGVLQRMIDDRLLTTDDDDDGEPRVDLAHEIMIAAWPTLAGWIQSHRIDEQRRRQLESDATEWAKHGRGARGLLDPIELADAQEWQQTESARELGQSADVAALIAASRSAHDKQRTRRRRLMQSGFAALTVFAIVVTTLAVMARYQANEANASRKRAEASDRESRRLLAQSLRDAGWQQLLGGHPQEAMPYLIAARQKGEDGELLRLLIGTATRFLPLIPILEHSGAVSSATFSSDGTRIVTASSDRTARVWDATTGKCLALLLGHQGEVNSAAFSPDSTRVITASSDHTARIWSVATGELLTTPLEHEGPVWKAAFSPDGTRVVTASDDHTARIWDAATGKLLAPPLQHQWVVWSAAFSHDGTRVVTASWDKTARVWDAATGKPLAAPLEHQDRVISAAFNPDGTRVVTASWDNTARVWDATTGKPLAAPFQHQGPVRSAAFSPDSLRVVTASSDKTARIWDAATGKPLASFAHPGAVRSAAFSPDGTRVVTANYDKTARIWDTVTGKPVATPLEHQGGVNSAMFSPDGTRVVTASLDNTARVWDAATGKSLVTSLEHQRRVNSAAFNPDGTRVVTAGYDNTARIWDVATGKLLPASLQHQREVLRATFSPDGTRVVTASFDNTARIWDAATGEPLASPLEHQAWVWSAAFSPDGTRIVTASFDDTARVWDAATGKPVASLLEHQGGVNSAAFNPDGTRVVTASDDDTARVWDAATGKLLAPPLQHQAAVYSAAFSPDGTHIITVSDDNIARVWETRLEEPAQSDWATLTARSPFVLSGTGHVRRAPEPVPNLAPRSITTPATTPGTSCSTAPRRGATVKSIPQSPDRLAEPIPFAPRQIWSGHYFCTQGRTSLALQITLVRDNTVDVVFAFSHAESGASGSHHASGLYDPTHRRLALFFDAWIRQPHGYRAVDLSGTVSADGSTFAGSIPTRGCTTFTVRRR